MAIIDPTEQHVVKFLAHRGFANIVHEPDGKVPPDFLLDNKIAVEVRRLNQNYYTGSRYRGLEEHARPLYDRMARLLRELGPPTDGTSWFVTYRFSRPVGEPKALLSKVKAKLVMFRDAACRHDAILQITPQFRVRIRRAGKSHDTFYVMGGYTDAEAGGWVVSEMMKNLEICVSEKTKKVDLVRGNYPIWWLALVDYVARGISSQDLRETATGLTSRSGWDKIIIIDPADHTVAYEI